MGDGTFLNNFLMPALDRAFLFADVHGVAVAVREYLDFDVARFFDVLFDVNCVITQRCCLSILIARREGRR